MRRHLQLSPPRRCRHAERSDRLVRRCRGRVGHTGPYVSPLLLVMFSLCGGNESQRVLGGPVAAHEVFIFRRLEKDRDVPPRVKRVMFSFRRLILAAHISFCRCTGCLLTQRIGRRNRLCGSMFCSFQRHLALRCSPHIPFSRNTL